MPSVKVSSKSSHSPQETFKRIRDLLENDPGLRKIDADYKCDFDESSLSGKAKGSKFTALLKVAPASSGADAEIVVELPFLLSPFKGQIQSTLANKLEKALA